MPGVPFEMKHMMTEHVIPILKEKFNTQSIIHKNIMTYVVENRQAVESSFLFRP